MHMRDKHMLQVSGETLIRWGEKRL